MRICGLSTGPRSTWDWISPTRPPKLARAPARVPLRAVLRYCDTAFVLRAGRGRKAPCSEGGWIAAFCAACRIAWICLRWGSFREHQRMECGSSERQQPYRPPVLHLA